MTFAIVLLYSLTTTAFFPNIWKAAQRDGLISYMLLSLTLIIPWVMICGGQYETGTDYHSYMETFETADVGLFYNKKEFLFAKLVEIWHGWGLPPQGLYFVFYTIASIFFISTCYKIDNKTLFIFILLYFTISNLFNNQLNGLRQSVATYVITYAVFLLNEHRGLLKFILLIVFASLFHASSWFALIIIAFNYLRPSKKILRLFLITSLLFTIKGAALISLAFDQLSAFVPEIYTHLLKSSFNQSIGLSSMLPKIIIFPLYYLSVNYLDIDKEKKNLNLYYIGIFCYMFRLVSIQNIILDRLGYIFVLLAVLPLYLYWTKLYYKHRVIQFNICLFICISLYLAKVLVLPEKEYLYNSVFYNAMAGI